MGKTKQGVSPGKSPLDAGFFHKRASRKLPITHPLELRGPARR